MPKKKKGKSKGKGRGKQPKRSQQARSAAAAPSLPPAFVARDASVQLTEHPLTVVCGPGAVELIDGRRQSLAIQALTLSESPFELCQTPRSFALRAKPDRSILDYLKFRLGISFKKHDIAKVWARLPLADLDAPRDVGLGDPIETFPYAYTDGLSAYPKDGHGGLGFLSDTLCIQLSSKLQNQEGFVIDFLQTLIGLDILVYDADASVVAAGRPEAMPTFTVHANLDDAFRGDGTLADAKECLYEGQQGDMAYLTIRNLEALKPGYVVNSFYSIPFLLNNGVIPGLYNAYGQPTGYLCHVNILENLVQQFSGLLQKLRDYQKQRPGLGVIEGYFHQLQALCLVLLQEDEQHGFLDWFGRLEDSHKSHVNLWFQLSDEYSTLTSEANACEDDDASRAATLKEAAQGILNERNVLSGEIGRNIDAIEFEEEGLPILMRHGWLEAVKLCQTKQAVSSHASALYGRSAAAGGGGGGGGAAPVATSSVEGGGEKTLVPK
jgi:hypothetical protein